MRVIHEMRQVGRLASGALEWACPTCGRRVALAEPPAPALTVLDPGDETAVHIGLTTPGRATANPGEPYGLGPVQEIPRPPSLPMLPADPPDTAAADRAWLAEIGIDWGGGEAA
ncbi:hypothetical protein P3T35_002714 [Kitasatospora sp. GP30]|nr:hypothetical protein [Kitasatospora sp. GP30]